MEQNNTAFISLMQVSEELGVSVNRVYQLISDKEIPHIRIGGGIKIPRAAWEKWMSQKTQDALASVNVEKEQDKCL